MSLKNKMNLEQTIEIEEKKDQNKVLDENDPELIQWQKERDAKFEKELKLILGDIQPEQLTEEELRQKIHDYIIAREFDSLDGWRYTQK